MKDSNDSAVSRRRFLKGAGAGLALMGLPEWFVQDAWTAEAARLDRRPRAIGPNDRIVFGAIGLGGSRGGFRQGLGDTRAAARQPGTQVVAVCDVDLFHMEEGVRAFGRDTAAYRDYRALLARPDIDAVVIGTPDHWHGKMALDAMRAGKHVYCEKPLTLTIHEGKELVKAQKETGVVFQTGSQQRSDGRFRLACELVRNGRIGKIKSVRAQVPGARGGGPFAPKPVPSDLDWDMWLGPAPMTAYIPQRTHGSFRYWYEYSGGMVTDWGAHHNDIAQWGLGRDRSGPIRIESVGKAPAADARSYNVHTEFDITYTYDDGVTLLCTSKGENGVRFEGENGWIFVSRGKIEASEPKLLSEPLPTGATRLYVSNNHMGNFVDCIREGGKRQPICDVETGHRSVSVCHLGNISLRLGGRKLEWDPVREEFKGDGDANAMVGRPMRGPWRV